MIYAAPFSPNNPTPKYQLAHLKEFCKINKFLTRHNFLPPTQSGVISVCVSKEPLCRLVCVVRQCADKSNNDDNLTIQWNKVPLWSSHWVYGGNSSSSKQRTRRITLNYVIEGLYLGKGAENSAVCRIQVKGKDRSSGGRWEDGEGRRGECLEGKRYK